MAIVVGGIEVSACDHTIHVALGDAVRSLNRPEADDLIHALHEAIEATR
jgi:hypothetical protein